MAIARAVPLRRLQRGSSPKPTPPSPLSAPVSLCSAALLAIALSAREILEGPEGLLGATSKGDQFPSTQLAPLLLLGQPQLLLQISVNAHPCERQEDGPGLGGRAHSIDAVVLEDEWGGILRNPTSLTPPIYVLGAKPFCHKGSGAWKGILVLG